MLDLWPADISHSRMKAPVTILKEQALLLQDKTQGIIHAKVRRLNEIPEQDHSQNNERFTYEFYLRAPAIGDYEYSLFNITHGIELYPIEFTLDKEIKHEFNPLDTDMYVTRSERDFLELLRKIFSAKKTRKVIHAMLAQSAEADNE